MFVVILSFIKVPFIFQVWSSIYSRGFIADFSFISILIRNGVLIINVGKINYILHNLSSFPLFILTLIIASGGVRVFWSELRL